MTAALCTLCEHNPATTSWGLPVCDECHAFLGRLDVDLKAMEAADPELAALGGIFTDRTKPYRERAREVIAARRQEEALPDHPDHFRVGDRVRRHESHPTSDGQAAYPTGIVEATHYASARPTVDVYWGTRAGGYGGDTPIRVITTEAPETLQVDDGPKALQPDEVTLRQAQEAGMIHERIDP